MDAARRSVRGALLRVSPIKIVVGGGLVRAIGARAYINGAFRRRFDASDSIWTAKADDPQTRPVALFLIRSMLQNLLAERHSAGPIARASWLMLSIVQPA